MTLLCAGLGQPRWNFELNSIFSFSLTTAHFRQNGTRNAGRPDFRQKEGMSVHVYDMPPTAAPA